ncbi:uncharacterized protein [Spinacia oleracea]|uniref:Transposase, Ptta/En/Spm, plant n=1 Tax=Spinacia oleracea TaxID=3562 RepID=A0ABM3RQF6_SPIOL|nr:uncharacterized protein LOC110785960 [Spinacia oleracea]
MAFVVTDGEAAEKRKVRSGAEEKMKQNMNPSEAEQLQQEVHQLEKDRVGSKRPMSAIVLSDKQGESSSARQHGAKKKGRGPTNMFDVHARKFEARVPIYCNDKGQPRGPEKHRKELTRFLGTIARDYDWAPLTYTNWQKVPNKDKVWEYVKSKYILPPESEEWVYETLDQSWRGFKCRLKKLHYYAYGSYEERLEHPPEGVPEAHFKTLLAYWETNAAKKTSLQNSENRKEQDNMHTVGPVSFAMRYDKMQAMRELEALQDDQNSESHKDSYI